MGKKELDTVEAIKAKLLEYNVVLYIHDDVVKDLKAFDPSNLKVMIALILDRAKKGLSIPPAVPLKGSNLNGYAKIKNRNFPFRGVYTSKNNPDGTEAMYLIAIGPKKDEKVYNLASKRINDESEYFNLLK